MASCKDCIHEGICDMPIITDGRKNASNCNKFKNKADFVDVVRCKNCKYCSHHYSIPLEEDIYQCRFEFGDDYPVPMVEATFYCGYGERKENK